MRIRDDYEDIADVRARVIEQWAAVVRGDGGRLPQERIVAEGWDGDVAERERVVRILVDDAMHAVLHWLDPEEEADDENGPLDAYYRVLDAAGHLADEYLEILGPQARAWVETATDDDLRSAAGRVLGLLQRTSRHPDLLARVIAVLRPPSPASERRRIRAEIGVTFDAEAEAMVDALSHDIRFGFQMTAWKVMLATGMHSREVAAVIIDESRSLSPSESADPPLE